MKSESNESEMNIFQKIWKYRKYFVIEPLILCWILPSCFLVIGIQNLGLEKACRVNLGFDKDICDSVLNSGIDCDEITLGDSETNSTDQIYDNLTIGSYDFNYTVCKAERETQKSVTYINGIRGPMAAIFPVLVILFAGGWSDKKGLRKPCMLFPMIGEALSCTALLISSIFMDTIPMEFGTILEKVLPAMLGGSTLMIMGIYSYLTVTTPEEDRIFRFGIFGTFANIIPIFGLPLAGIFYTQLGYIKLFILGDVFFILGILYLIFFVKEVESTGDQHNQEIQNTSGEHDNYAFQMTAGDVDASTDFPNSNRINKTEIVPATKKNFLIEFFDPTLAYGCVEVFLRKREKNRRLYLIILVVAYAIFLGPTLGEVDYLYQFSLISLKWDGEQYSLYSTYSTAIVTVGTFLMTGVFSKIFKMSDSMVGFVSSVCTIISRPMFAFAKGSILFYAGGTVDMFVSAKTIAIKTIISIMVAEEEIGRLYAVLGISDAAGGFIFPPLYSYVYSSTIDTFPGAFFLFGEIFFIPNALLFLLTYILLRRQKGSEEKQAEIEEEQGNKNFEITHI